MSLDSVKKDLRKLPYTEMKALGAQIYNALTGRKESMSGEQICETLATLPIEDTSDLDMEEKYLETVFTRKLAITVSPMPYGYSIKLQNGYGPQIQSRSLRTGMSDFLDALAAYRALEQ